MMFLPIPKDPKVKELGQMGSVRHKKSYSDVFSGQPSAGIVRQMGSALIHDDNGSFIESVQRGPEDITPPPNIRDQDMSYPRFKHILCDESILCRKDSQSVC